jgi:cytochrome c biogenesis protein ResB
MEFGTGKVPELSEGKVNIFFDEAVRTLPFSIALKEFEVVTYPGSSRPAQYRSQITITPASKNLPAREEVISMNRPLDEQGFRLFQSSYRLGEGDRPDATILSISHDPGVLIVYISFALIVLGISWYLRNQSRQAMMISRAVDRAQQSLARAGNDERQ